MRGLQPNVPAQADTTPDVRSAPLGTARLEILGRRTGSLVEVRKRSQAAKTPEYSGTIERGQKQRFTGKAFWLYVQTPKNVIVKVNGNRVQLLPAVKHQGVFVTAKSVYAAEKA